MNLPNASEAVVEPSKITGYLLANEHPEGAGKATFFTRFGFSLDGWERLADALVAHAEEHPVSSVAVSPYGTKYLIDGPIHCPDGRMPAIRAVWIIDRGATAPRLVTAYPL